MKVTETREEMLRVIRAVKFGGKTYGEYVNELCDKLMSLGAFIPPAKIGDTVYAACPALDENDEDIIDEYKVRGCGVTEEGDIFVLDACKEINIVCDMYCNLTREEAEMWLKKEKKNGKTS